MAELLLYRASAGSGKTHALVTHYIQWALRHPDAFKHILAVTFTNRATQEMKQRIANSLYSLARGEQTALWESLCRAGWEPSPLQARSKEVLTAMLYQYGDFAVTTIDGFFHKIVQNFSQELGLPLHFAIELDPMAALQEVVDELLERLPETPLLQAWIVEFALQKIGEGKSWNVQQDMQQMGKTLFEESFKTHEQSLRNDLLQPACMERFANAVDAVRESFESTLAAMGQKALDCIAQAGFLPTDFAYGVRGIWGYFSNLATKKSFEPTKRAYLARGDAASWLTKTKKTQEGQSMQRFVEATLLPLLEEALAAYERDHKLYRTALVLSRYRYAFGVIGALTLGLENYRSKHSVLFLSDVAALLFRLVRENETPFVYEKIGNQYRHYLIDEFQDLSVFQWTNLKPLIQNSLAQGFSNLLVGDVKQSIYRWRGSEWKLLNHQVESEWKESRVHALTTNRRSQEIVVTFNNFIFGRAAQNLFNYLESELTSIDEAGSAQWLDGLWAECIQMKRAYSDASQQKIALSSQTNGGYAELLLLRSKQDAGAASTGASMRATQKEALRRQLQQLKESGMPAQDIVLLVRDNKEADLLLDWFNRPEDLEEMPYGIQSDRSCLLSSCVMVKTVLHALHCLVDEKDAIHKIAFVQGYCKQFAHRSVVLHTGTPQAPLADIDRFLPKSFLEQKAYLQHAPVYHCVERLFALLFPGKRSESICCFQRVVLDFCSKAPACTKAFLRWWEKRGHSIKIPLPSAAHAVRILTIHQSKGLEFRTVLVPFCSWHLDHLPHQGPILWSDAAHPLSFFSAWPTKYGKELQGTHYAPIYYLEKLQIHLDHLNLLYVACTRAVERLYVTAPVSGDQKKPSTIADLLHPSMGTAPDPTASRHLHVQETDLGTRFWMG